MWYNYIIKKQEVITMKKSEALAKLRVASIEYIARLCGSCRGASIRQAYQDYEALITAAPENAFADCRTLAQVIKAARK